MVEKKDKEKSESFNSKFAKGLRSVVNQTRYGWESLTEDKDEYGEYPKAKARFMERQKVIDSDTRFKSGGPVRGMGCAKRGAGRAMKGGR